MSAKSLYQNTLKVPTLATEGEGGGRGENRVGEQSWRVKGGQMY